MKIQNTSITFTKSNFHPIFSVKVWIDRTQQGLSNGSIPNFISLLLLELFMSKVYYTNFSPNFFLRNSVFIFDATKSKSIPLCSSWSGICISAVRFWISSLGRKLLRSEVFLTEYNFAPNFLVQFLSYHHGSCTPEMLLARTIYWYKNH